MILAIIKNHHYIALTKPSALSATQLSNLDGDKFCLICFNNFQNEGLLKKSMVL